MNDLTIFATVLAWIFGILNIVLIALRITFTFTYSEIDRMMDQMKGYTREWPIIKPIIVVILCTAWLITQRMGQ